MSTPGSLLATLLISGSVAALALGIYDVTVRQPRTPRLAVVDIARLFAAAEQRAKDNVLNTARIAPRAAAAGSAAGGGIDTGPAAELAGLQAAGRFGPALEKVLNELSGECRCAIVAMAAVIGGTAAVPDYTEAAAQRLGVTLRPSTAR
jgi:hypothetical protein